MSRWLAAVLALVALAAAGCGGSDNGTAEPVAVEGSEYAYVMPDEIDGGVVAMRFRNSGKEPHEFSLSRIDDGHTIEETVQGKEPSWYLSVPQPGTTAEDFGAWVEGGQKGEAPWRFVGAMQSFPSGESIFVTLDLEAGTTYRLEDDPDGLPAVEFTPR